MGHARQRLHARLFHQERRLCRQPRRPHGVQRLHRRRADEPQRERQLRTDPQPAAAIRPARRIRQLAADARRHQSTAGAPDFPRPRNRTTGADPYRTPGRRCARRRAHDTRRARSGHPARKPAARRPLRRKHRPPLCRLDAAIPGPGGEHPAATRSGHVPGRRRRSEYFLLPRLLAAGTRRSAGHRTRTQSRLRLLELPGGQLLDGVARLSLPSRSPQRAHGPAQPRRQPHADRRPPSLFRRRPSQLAGNRRPRSGHHVLPPDRRTGTHAAPPPANAGGEACRTCRIFGTLRTCRALRPRR